MAQWYPHVKFSPVTGSPPSPRMVCSHKTPFDTGPRGRGVHRQRHSHWRQRPRQPRLADHCLAVRHRADGPFFSQLVCLSSVFAILQAGGEGLVSHNSFSSNTESKEGWNLPLTSIHSCVLLKMCLEPEDTHYQNPEHQSAFGFYFSPGKNSSAETDSVMQAENCFTSLVLISKFRFSQTGFQETSSAAHRRPL